MLAPMRLHAAARRMQQLRAARACYCSPSASSSSSSSSSPTIALTPRESQLFDFLLYVQHLHAPQTQLRVAGGWVRDKLRGAPSEDIDIALDNMHGRTFAQCITKFQRQRKLPPSSVGVVKANSDKSKHLEVAQVKVDGMLVDLVHLRAEAYTTDSRIPEASFAAPRDDALRRDLTINALFYNLHTRCVEDLTGMGLEDLRQQRIRTPLAPTQTFLDDPLRVLRAVRFAAELGFALDDALVSALQPPQAEAIHEAMARKVSRERVGIEARKMLSGKDPARAFALLAQLELLPLVFHQQQQQQQQQQQEEEEKEEDGTRTSLSLPAEVAALQQQFSWRQSPETVARSLAHLTHLQHTRRVSDNHSVSFVEATAAILAPFVLAKGEVNTLVPSCWQTAETLAQVTTLTDAALSEPVLIEQALQFLRHREHVGSQLPKDALIELLKINVKWPKPAAKRVALIVEAMRAFPPQASGVALCLWSLHYRDVLVPAITTLLTELDCVDEAARRAQVTALVAVATRFTQPCSSHSHGHDADTSSDSDGMPDRRRPVDGQAVRECLGGAAGPAIGRALAVLNVYEAAHPQADRAALLAFVTRLRPALQAEGLLPQE